ncbi:MULTISPECIES: tyrosine-type recombinase/integrase [unclassified Shewanella]|uniref:tyrosine-type recombinase/integrase n=1 Tax=unclassified Shewanella TaxID=196818 RepID=UPI000C855218|nr:MULTISPECIES: tyrosine-type recombinase/integrase [unclassified Shewanella]MDO6777441.1 tyrosine-type recombinase/integrase [Shewanella sp. 3_MG-2023]PMG31706.1 integrase [Shewanella sp. 10N.286.52.C2]PMH87780.1 integrase [Shewanella sp. 10N.286.48.B5]
MIKLPKYNIGQQDALLSAQNHVGSYTNYLKDVLEPAIKSGEWDDFEALDIGFSVTGESLGKIGDNNAWRQLQSFFEPYATKKDTLDFFLNGKVMERNLTNQLKALALSMMWLSPKDYSFMSIAQTITGLKKVATALLNKGHNSFELLSFELLEAWVLGDVTVLDFEREHTYVALKKLFIEATRLPFKVNLTKALSASDFGLTINEPVQYTVIPQRLYYLGLQQSEALVNELYPIRDELSKLSNYIADYNDKTYQGYAKYLVSDEAQLKNDGLRWYFSSANKGSKEKNIAFQSAFLALNNPTQESTLELLNKHKPALHYEYVDKFHPERTLTIGNRKITGLREAQSLFKQLNGGCLWALMSRTGMRADETFHLHTANGCTTETISGQTIYVIHADLSKTAKGSQSKQDEFVTTEVGKKAYEILQALHSPLRQRHPDSQAFFHKTKEGCGATNKDNLTRHTKKWFEGALGKKLALTNDDVIDLKISDPNLSFNVGDDYNFSGHQLRRSFAYYLIGFELCAFPQLKQQFSHVSMAMTRHYAKNASKFQKIRKQKQSLAHAIDEERIDQKAQVYLNIYKKLANKERVAGGKGKEFAKNIIKAERNLFKDKVDNDMLSLNYWKNQIRDQKRHIHAVAPGVYCTSTGCSLRTQVNLLECVDCKNDYIVDAVFAEAKRKEAEIHMLWDIEHDELTPQTASEVYVKITAAERIMKDLDISYEPVVIPQEVQDMLIPCGVTA